MYSDYTYPMQNEDLVLRKITVEFILIFDSYEFKF